MAALPLNQDPFMAQRMEQSLISNCTDALAEYPDLNANVMGVFSLDDMEKLQESSLAERIAIGVALISITPVSARRDPQYNGEGGPAGKMLDFTFMVILGLPANDQYPRRFDASAILSILRFHTLGTGIEDGRMQRPWEFVQEKPEIADSTRTMLYYSQLWRVTIPIVAKPRQNP